jgi:hypothetical protein
MPTTSSTVVATMINPAGRLKTMGMPKRCGALARISGYSWARLMVVEIQSGRCTPKPDRNDLK